jgi:hypothetical protein
MAAGDLDGDGDLDFVVRNSSGGPDVFVVDQGTALALSGTAPAQPPTYSFALADIDRDLDLDLVRSHDVWTMSLALNDGLGNFTDAPSRLPPFTIYSTHVHAADLERDGDPDLLTCLWGTPTLLLWNRHLHLDAGPASLGQAWTVDLWSQPGYATGDALGRLAVGLVALPVPLVLPPFGELWLDLGAGFLLVEDVIAQAAGKRSFAFAIPAAPQLLGIALHVQGLVEAMGAPPRLSALRVVQIQ